MDVFIESERLIIRPLMLSDDQGIFEMDADMEVHRYVGMKPVEKIEQTRDVIRFVQQQYAELGIGRWAVIEKGTNDFVGWTGHKLMKERVNGRVDYYDFGYRLAKRFWGKGYATESGKAALHYGIDTLKLKDICAMTDVNNMASRHVLEKLGFRLMEIFNYDAAPTWRKAGQPTTWYQWTDRK